MSRSSSALDCKADDMHPYECGGPGKCIHCDRIISVRHDPDRCPLCDEGERSDVEIYGAGVK